MTVNFSSPSPLYLNSIASIYPHHYSSLICPQRISQHYPASDFRPCRLLSPSTTLHSLFNLNPRTHVGIMNKCSVLKTRRVLGSMGLGATRFTRADWQTSCAILSSNVNGDKAENDGVLEVNGHHTLNLVPVPKKMSKALTIADLSPDPSHGSTIRLPIKASRERTQKLPQTRLIRIAMRFLVTSLK